MRAMALASSVCAKCERQPIRQRTQHGGSIYMLGTVAPDCGNKCHSHNEGDNRRQKKGNYNDVHSWPEDGCEFHAAMIARHCRGRQSTGL